MSPVGRRGGDDGSGEGGGSSSRAYAYYLLPVKPGNVILSQIATIVISWYVPIAADRRLCVKYHVTATCHIRKVGAGCRIRKV